jgi:hypothetical protein
MDHPLPKQWEVGNTVEFQDTEWTIIASYRRQDWPWTEQCFIFAEDKFYGERVILQMEVGCDKWRQECPGLGIYYEMMELAGTPIPENEKQNIG